MRPFHCLGVWIAIPVAQKQGSVLPGTMAYIASQRPILQGYYGIRIAESETSMAQRTTPPVSLWSMN
jgi:hypothetical protein